MLALLLWPVAIVWFLIEIVFTVAVLIIALALQLFLIIVNVILWPIVWVIEATREQNNDWDKDGNNIT